MNAISSLEETSRVPWKFCNRYMKQTANVFVNTWDRMAWKLVCLAGRRSLHRQTKFGGKTNIFHGFKDPSSVIEFHKPTMDRAYNSPLENGLVAFVTQVRMITFKGTVSDNCLLNSSIFSLIFSFRSLCFSLKKNILFWYPVPNNPIRRENNTKRRSSLAIQGQVAGLQF